MKFVCVGRNYAKHAQELGNEVPDEPVIFIKPAECLQVGSVHEVLPVVKSLHYECELVFRLAQPLFQASVQEALTSIDAYGLGIDFTDRVRQDELKKKQLPWELAKSFRGSVVISEWRQFAPDQVLAPIRFSLRKNGATVQSGDSSMMLFRLDYLLSFISQYLSLEAGDVLFTGTPEGVGPAKVGDVLDGYLQDERMFSVQIA